MKIIIDAMGGDNAPGSAVEGALQALSNFDDEIVLVGRESEILSILKGLGSDKPPVGMEIVHASEVITMEDEDLSDAESYELFDPDYTWKRKTVSGFVARQLLTPIFLGGKQVYRFPPEEKIRAYCAGQVESLWEEVVRFEYPHNYYVDLSEKLWNCKQELLHRA